MIKYTVRKYNSIYKGWSIYHSTCDMSSAYRLHAELVEMGYQATITSENVEE